MKFIQVIIWGLAFIVWLIDMFTDIDIDWVVGPLLIIWGIIVISDAIRKQKKWSILVPLMGARVEDQLPFRWLFCY